MTGALVTAGAAAVLAVAIERMRAGAGSGVADVIIAGLTVVAAAIVGNADATLAFVTAANATGAFAAVVHADVVDTALAATAAFGIVAATIGWDAGIAAAALRCRTLATLVASRGWAAGVVATAHRTATLVVTSLATFVLGFAEDQRILAAEFFAVAATVATCVIATFGVSGGSHGHRRAAARRTAFAQPAGTCADPTYGNLHAGALDWCGCGGWPAGRIGVTLQQGSTHDGSAPEPEYALEHRAAAGAIGERFDERIETTIVHSRNLPERYR